MSRASQTGLQINCSFLGNLALLAIFMALTAGCIRLALRMSPSVFDNFSVTLLKECDPELAKDALPGQLKLAETFLKEDPRNRKILESLCMGYAGYALLFVEQFDPKRASRLYYRALGYGLRAMGIKDIGIKMPSSAMILQKLKLAAPSTAFWTSVAWLRWINLNLDNPTALAQSPLAQACLEYVIKTQPDYFYGASYAVMGSVLASKASGLGGELASAKRFFENALNISKGKLYLVQFLYARYYAVAKQDRRLFSTLLLSILDGRTGSEDVCLINQVIKRWAKKLLENIDDFFI
ncbi:MAG TPA: hypothetical protein ENG73_00645 [Desulfobacterales bacterium]|nr:hypothetical protein [Desulfobacterales bacterium]